MGETYMMGEWILHIKEFGKIMEATVQPAPFTVFIGDNNSGKSYLMTLLYGILSVDFHADHFVFREDSAVFQKCAEIVKNQIRQLKRHSVVEYHIEKSQLRLYQKLLNELLALNKAKFLKKLFNRELDLEEMRIEFQETAKFRFHFTLKEVQNEEVLYISTNRSSWRIAYEERFLDIYIVWSLAHILQGMLQSGAANPIYFPTARTGFLLTYKELTRSALKERFSLETTEKNLLTKPNTDFLMGLSSLDISRQNESNQNLTEFIEKHILSGRIQTSGYPMLEIEYQPDGTADHLPMYISSAVVTETVPLLLFLKYGTVRAFLVEEPEISLHPKLQWEMARVLIRMVNTDLPVVVTTHSDIMIQHMNNMIKAGTLNCKEHFFQQTGYQKEDLLSKEQVAVYQFEEGKDGKTRLTRLPGGDDGFEAMTFYQTLKKINEQIDFIEDEREPNHVL